LFANFFLGSTINASSASTSDLQNVFSPQIVPLVCSPTLINAPFSFFFPLLIVPHMHFHVGNLHSTCPPGIFFVTPSNLPFSVFPFMFRRNFAPLSLCFRPQFDFYQKLVSPAFEAVSSLVLNFFPRRAAPVPFFSFFFSL